MRNKHLIYLFFAVLALGLLLRWLPVRYRSVFHSSLLGIEPDLVQRLLIEVPGQPALEINFVHGDWIAMQSGKTAVIARDSMLSMLNALAEIAFFQTVKSDRPDTLGFEPEAIRRLVVTHGNSKSETIEIGKESVWNNQPVTIIRLPGHSGIYRVPGRLRTVFTRNLDDFRPELRADFDPAAIRKIGVQRTGSMPVYLSGPDSLKCWIFASDSSSIAADSVLRWLGFFNRLQGAPFADYFDESLAGETFHTKIVLGLESGQFLTYRFFYVRPPTIPEDLSRARNTGYKPLPVYVLHTSQNPSNFFAIPDSNLAVFLCNGPAPTHK